MNSDARMDVVLTTTEPISPVLIFGGRGDGALAPPTALPPLDIPGALNDGTNQLVCADVNGDSRTDIIIGHNESNIEMVSVRLNRGNGGFDLAFTLPTPYPVDIAAGDINRDGKPDLVIANYTENSVSYAINLGAGKFQKPEVLPAGDRPRSVTLADFTRDGWLDIAVANSGDHSLSVWIHSGRPRPRFPVER